MNETLTKILRNFSRVLGSIALLAIATVSSATATSISKTFEFGEGTPQTRSHVRTYSIPCGLEVAAVVKFQRLGPDGATNDIPIVIEFREPDTALNQEGPIVETKNAIARKIEQTIILRSQPNNRGCALPWRVRVKHANDGTAPFPTFGSIRLDFDGRERSINVEAVKMMQHGWEKTVNVGDSGGLDQGAGEITATWYHYIGAFYIRGANPIKFKVQLLDPSGAVVKTVDAYSSNEARGDLPKFKLAYQIANRVTGQWKLKMTNLDSSDDAYVDGVTVKFTPGCPN